MRYIQYHPAIDGDKNRLVAGLSFPSENDCDAYCLLMNQDMVSNHEECGKPTPLYRYKSVSMIQWGLLVTESFSVVLFIVFLHKWTHGHYESALCALAARIMLFGLPVVSLNPVGRQ